MKRLLCCVLMSAMLLGVTMQGIYAATFSDANEITYIDAVNATTEMGLFAGSDGKFLPKQSVTRAQMATIIVKMLKGSDFNADSYKGASNPFPDTAGFQGGWAEGYINACAQMGVVKGYGDGSFQPGKAVNAAEAVTMIINALQIKTGAGNWPDTYMAKAEELKLFGEISPKPDAYDTLVRDQLAVIVLQGVKQMEKDEAEQQTPSSSNKPSGGVIVIKPNSGSGSSSGSGTTTPEQPEQGGATGSEPTLGENETPLRPGTGGGTGSDAEQPEQGGTTGDAPALGEDETPLRPGTGSGEQPEQGGTVGDEPEIGEDETPLRPRG